MGWPGPVSHRQWAAWIAWKVHCDVQMAPPTLTDFQLMRVAQRVQQVLSRSPSSITLEDQRVEFSSPLKTRTAGKPGDARHLPPGLDPDAVSRHSQAQWIPAMKDAPGYKLYKGSQGEALPAQVIEVFRRHCPERLPPELRGGEDEQPAQNGG